MFGDYEDYTIYEDVMAGGRWFLDRRLTKLIRETQEEFISRRATAPVVNVARDAVNEKIDLFSRRLPGVLRSGLPQSFVRRMTNIDNCGRTLEQFYEDCVLKELFSKGRVYIYVDRDVNGEDDPYLICTPYNWTEITDKRIKFGSTVLEFENGLWKNRYTQYTPGELPLIEIRLRNSLLVDAAYTQVALSQIESVIAQFYAEHNRPYYVEPYHQAMHPAGVQQDKNRLSSSRGTQYPIGGNEPGFLITSSQTADHARLYCDHLAQNIRQSVGAQIVSNSPIRASAESRSSEERALNNGLVGIANKLQQFELRMLKAWVSYTGEIANPAIEYPVDFIEEPISTRLDLVEKLTKIQIPHSEFQAAIAELGASILFPNRKFSFSEVVTLDAKTIHRNVELGVLDPELAGEMFGYPDGTAAKAAKAHAERLLRLAEAQTAKSQREHEKQADDKPELEKQERGEGK